MADVSLTTPARFRVKIFVSVPQRLPIAAATAGFLPAALFPGSSPSQTAAAISASGFGK